MVFIRFWTQHYNMIQSFLQQLGVMCVGTGKNYRQWKPLLIRQDTAFCPEKPRGVQEGGQLCGGVRDYTARFS